MAKQLKVDFAELTDIGRRRSVNQDNLAQRVPDDPQELERNGALFVVADGMGGHAAGEIASTVAVNTICSAYFDNTSGDVLQGLAQAIKRANEAILNIARENTDHTGMGTTLVAAVLCQGILYVANIGDSRAYIIRHGKLRQLTEDHSWVAEQVRAGVLTEEQARSHVHRNVITRSLGTQSNVTADVFVEPVKEGDVLLLCSDGLHGYVSDDVIAATAKTLAPVDAARKLIDLANEAGGPDNITVTIIKVNEVSAPPVDLLERLQLLKEQPRPTKPMPIVAASPERTPVSAPEPPSPLATAPTKIVLPRQRGRRRTGAILLRLVAVVFLIAFSVAAWDFTLGPFALSRQVTLQVNGDLARVNSDLGTLNALPPAQQLTVLARDQKLLQNDLKLQLTGAERAQIQTALDSKLTPATRQALTTYNAQAKIVSLNAAGATSLTVPCAASLQSLVSIAGTKASTLYGRDATNQVIPLAIAGTAVTCGNPVAANVVGLSATGAQLELLIQPTTGPMSVASLDSKGKLSTVLTLPASSDNSASYTHIAFSGAVYALVKHNSATNADSVVEYAGPKFSAAKPTEIAASQPVLALAYGKNNLLYLLLHDGSLATLAPGQQSLHVVGDLQVDPALPLNDPNNYTSATPVPTLTPEAALSRIANPELMPVAAQNSAFIPARATATPTPSPTETPLPAPLTGPSTSLPTATTLAVDGNAVPHVAVADGQGHRAILLQTTGVDLALVQQYTDASQLDHLAALTFAPDGHTLYLLTTTGMLSISLP